MFILYRVYNDNDDNDPNNVSQIIIHYACNILNIDLEPSHIIEQNFPIILMNRLPSIYCYRTQLYHIGKDHVYDYYRKTSGINTIVEDAIKWFHGSDKNSIQYYKTKSYPQIK